jgi:hypothetical protein
MQLDRNRIVIRERGWLDLFDLALRVIRVYAGPLALSLAVGVLPAMLFNAWLLSGLCELDFDGAFPQWYLFWMLIVVLAEIPLVTAPATLYLGEAVFFEHPSVRSVAGGFFRALPQLVFLQTLLRVIFLPMVVTWFVPFAIWPYLNEVILLERNPLWPRRRAQMTTFRRVKALHAGGVGDMFGRWLASAAFAAMLFAAFWATMQFLAGLLLNEWALEGLTYTFYYPLALWIVAGYFTVVRFLGYLDLRIRREGWEVELMMRAEEARLSREMT